MILKATNRRSRVGQESEGVRGKHGQGPLLWFLLGGLDEAGKTV